MFKAESRAPGFFAISCDAPGRQIHCEFGQSRNFRDAKFAARVVEHINRWVPNASFALVVHLLKLLEAERPFSVEIDNGEVVHAIARTSRQVGLNG